VPINNNNKYNNNNPRRLYVKKKEGGRGVLQMEAIRKAEITNISEYLNTKDQFVNIVKSHESNQV
jgi:hypothetical protein